jgi:FkbM family methyltransferase
MLELISRRVRLLLKSELDLQKDRLLAELRADQNAAVEAEKRSQEAALEKHLGAQAFERGIPFDRTTREFIFQGLRLLNSLAVNAGATFQILPDGRLEVQIGAAAFVPETTQEIGILKEIFEDEVYFVDTREPMFVWDIGANVAAASLYFASVHGWDVAAYELFPKTAAAAEDNIRRSGLGDKIELNVVGLGAKTEKLTVTYNEASRGSNGLFGNTGKDKSGEEQSVEVRVVDVAEEIEKVVRRAGNRPILAKIDCEGAEYEILPRLAQTGKLRLLTAIILEEHSLTGRNRSEILTPLRDAGFIVRRDRRMEKEVSMMFAVRI